jgi:hypothetical protein
VGVGVPCRNPRAAEYPGEGKADADMRRTGSHSRAVVQMKTAVWVLRLFYEMQTAPQIVPVWVRRHIEV